MQKFQKELSKKKNQLLANIILDSCQDNCNLTVSKKAAVQRYEDYLQGMQVVYNLISNQDIINEVDNFRLSINLLNRNGLIELFDATKVI